MTQNIILFRQGFVGEGILNCAACDSPTSVHPQCFPIEIPDSDPYFPSRDAEGNKLCIPATRSMPGQLSLGQYLFSIRTIYSLRKVIIIPR